MAECDGAVVPRRVVGTDIINIASCRIGVGKRQLPGIGSKGDGTSRAIHMRRGDAAAADRIGQVSIEVELSDQCGAGRCGGEGEGGGEGQDLGSCYHGFQEDEGTAKGMPEEKTPPPPCDGEVGLE